LTVRLGLARAAGGIVTPDGSERPYVPGVCNIGPAEIARRRRAGHTGLVATVVLFAVLVALHAPPIARLLLFLPAAGAAIGYLQAWFRFCAGFGARGVFNFGELGRTRAVEDAAARARDRAMAMRLALASSAIGAAAAIVAVLLPV
jgi:hypothetical protein